MFMIFCTRTQPSVTVITQQSSSSPTLELAFDEEEEIMIFPVVKMKKLTGYLEIQKWLLHWQKGLVLQFREFQK